MTYELLAGNQVVRYLITPLHWLNMRLNDIRALSLPNSLLELSSELAQCTHTEPSSDPSMMPQMFGHRPTLVPRKHWPHVIMEATRLAVARCICRVLVADKSTYSLSLLDPWHPELL